MAVGAVVLAAGSGSRLGQAKQYLDLTPGSRLVDHAVAAVAAVADWVGVVLPGADRDQPWTGPPVDGVCGGGGSRQRSLQSGMAIVPPEIEIVLVHSASHPLASADLCKRLVAAVETGADGAVPFLDAVDVIKRRGDDGSLVTVGRETLGAAQCPMAFARPILDRAISGSAEVTEESQAVERVGGSVISVPGEVTNVHVVDQPSLAMARTLALARLEGGPSES